MTVWLFSGQTKQEMASQELADIIAGEKKQKKLHDPFKLLKSLW